MFDVAPTELLLVAIVALLVIGPKDLPRALRFVGHWVGKARGVARQFRSGFDSMVREAEMADMEKKWAEENARIMREHPVDASHAPQAALMAPGDDAAPAAQHVPAEAPSAPPLIGDGRFASEDAAPRLVEPPVVRPAFNDAPPPPTSDRDAS
ncbi:Sec-independent protein translocase protein TatB [Sphingomonas donggukensis]|uniref:Sec-independent protein translocase protein TatB n=1 Tax=Sphingomonas donggukensis TaxID=2949093 RepID=A0ABY4TWX9_9SPHN|nr:Sec-independent protein translocase protein TatB [Sphingomonas donggukensis]URW76901.1 Sec-independent protein translocase protein TatB [Sphingomonas donggukensis]